jgi:AcrR family transcriptional regulator
MSITLDVSRDTIVEAADALFYGRGIQSVGMDDIRTAAGVSLKKLYSVFPSKESLVIAVLASRHEVWESGIAHAVNLSTTPRDKLLAMYDFLEQWFGEESFRGCGFINAFGELGATSPAIVTIAREHKESFQRYVEELVRAAGLSGPDAEELAAELALLAEGAQTTAAIAGTVAPAAIARRAATTLIDAALDGR